MKVKLSDIAGQHPQQGFLIVNASLVKLALMDLPMKQAYWLKRIAKACEGEVKQAEELRVQLVKKYGEQQGEGWKVKADQEEAFNAEYAELLDSDVDLPGDGIALDSLGDIKVSAIDLMKLEWLFTDNQPEQAATAGA